MIEMTRREFEELVSDALDELPAALTDLMDNVALFVEDAHPSEPGLLGLYEGVALTERDHTYSGWLPDRITIYRRPTLAICSTRVCAVRFSTSGSEPVSITEISRPVPPPFWEAKVTRASGILCS